MSALAQTICVPKYVFKRMAMLDFSLPQLLSDLSIEPTALLHGETIMSLTKYHALWQSVVRLTQDKAIGINIANSVHPEHFGVVDYSVMTSNNLRDAFKHLAHYNRVKKVCDLSIDDAGTVVLDWPNQDLPVQHIESALVYLVALFRWLSGEHIKPKKVFCSFPRPDYFALFEQYFEAKVRFAQGKDMVVFEQSELDLPVIWQNSNLNKTFVGKVSEKVNALHQQNRFCDKVSQLIDLKLSSGNPVASDVAATLNVSLRTLHRKLSQDDASFQQLLDNVRKRHALSYIETEGIECKTIAYRLGYANPSAFNRAFARWTGQTPMAYRKGKV